MRSLDFFAIAFLIPASIRDAKSRQIPNWVSIGILVLAFTKAIVISGAWKHCLIGLALASVVMLPIYFLRRKNNTSLGGGDVKLIIALGAYLGSLMLMWVLFIAAVFGLIYVFMTKQKSVPFAPFLSAGYLMVMLLRIVIII